MARDAPLAETRVRPGLLMALPAHARVERTLPRQRIAVRIVARHAGKRRAPLETAASPKTHRSESHRERILHLGGLGGEARVRGAVALATDLHLLPRRKTRGIQHRAAERKPRAR